MFNSFTPDIMKRINNMEKSRTARKQSGQDLAYRRIVVKLGTHLVAGSDKVLNLDVISGLTDQIASLHSRGAQVIIVSSGAITSGRQKLGLSRKIRGIPYKQVLAAVGQSRLMNTYEHLFERHNITVAQALLTKQDLSDRAGYLNARNTLLAIMDLKVICIVNENDVVSIDEIKEAKFGDNDNLSAMVANLVDADLLLMLTDIDGLYDADPAKNPEAKLVPVVAKVDTSIKKMGAATRSNVGTGGMITKLEAAKLATSSGINVIIANGFERDVITRVASGESLGTRFLPVRQDLESRERWMVSGLCTRGSITVDDGATRALKKENRSLLAAGVVATEGKYSRGDIVAILDPEGNQMGCGIVNYNCTDINTIKGLHSTKIAGLLTYDYGPEVVHRNNLALIEREESSGHR